VVVLELDPCTARRGKKKPLTLQKQNNGVGNFLPYAGIIRVRFDGYVLSGPFFGGSHPEYP